MQKDKYSYRESETPDRLSSYFLCCLPVLVAIMLLSSYSCTRLEGVFEKSTPRESYTRAMEDSPIAKTETWNRWLTIGDSSLVRSVPIPTPYQQKIIYFPDQPDAWTWKIEAKAGRRLEFKCVPVDTSHILFMDLFGMDDKGTDYLESANDTLLSYVVEENKILIVRIQPELLILGQATFSVKDYPTLGFPVEGGRQSDIGSFWGDPRDGGARLHKGVDIFATRGTPVLAASEGRISRTGNGGLGGKTVWQRNKGLSLYYAHLDSINVRFGQPVQAGDTIGFVGNTGNARTTPPHLHFGIYDRQAVDPLPFIRNPETNLSPFKTSLNQNDRWGRINSSVANVRSTPSTDQKPATSLNRNQIVVLRGVTNGWYDVMHSQDLSGFIHSSLVTSQLTPLRNIEVNVGDSVFYSGSNQDFMFISDQNINLESYGSFGRFILTRMYNHWTTVMHSFQD